MDFHFLYFVLFSFVLIALILFIIFFLDGLKQVKDRFKWRHAIIYLLGTFFILTSLSLSYFLYRHGPAGLALLVLLTLNGCAAYFLYKASTTIRGKDWEEG